MAKFPGSIMGALFIVFALLVGCGGDPSNLPTDTPSGSLDSGTCPSGACDDAGLAVDVTSPAEGVSPPTDTGSPAVDVVVCEPRYSCSDSYGRDPGTCCHGQVCRPNIANPHCVGAASCLCQLPESMEQMCGPGSSPDCRTTVARLMTERGCTPGNNRCLVNLPDQDAPHPRWFLDQFDWEFAGLPLQLRLNRGMRTRAALMAHTYRWPSGGGGGGSLNFRCEDGDTTGGIQTFNGFFQTCFRSNWDTRLMAAMGDVRHLMECSGRSCYWNRSNGMRAVQFSAQVDWDSEPDPEAWAETCEIRLRVWRPGQTEPFFEERGFAANCRPFADQL
jgi:hypothetical protein